MAPEVSKDVIMPLMLDMEDKVNRNFLLLEQILGYRQPKLFWSIGFIITRILLTGKPGPEMYNDPLTLLFLGQIALSRSLST